MVHSFYCFLCLWISLLCLYLDNNRLVSFLIVWWAKTLFFFMIKSISCFRLFSTFIGKSKQVVFGSVIMRSLLLLIYTSIVIMSWLNCYELFWRFYYANKKDIVFDCFCFLVCMNNFQILLVLVTLEVWLTV